MAGIAGYVARPRADPTDAGRVAAVMAGQLRYTGEEETDLWTRDGYAIARVHHGKVSPGKQPVHATLPAGSVALVLDGEVFHDGPAPDGPAGEGAERCLRLYVTRGAGVFAHLNGSFAVAIYHAGSGEVLLATDRFSSRPLFYAERDGWLAFASQLRALLTVPGFPRALDLRAIQEFFTFQRVLEDRTYYRDARVLPPATILRYREGTLTLARYWSPRYEDRDLPAAHFVEALPSALRTAVARRTRTPLRTGLLLSAGFDSRAVLAGLDRPVTTFTVGDHRNTEVRIAERLAATKGYPHQYLERDRDHYYRIVEEAVDIGDGMHNYFHAHFLGMLGGIRKQVDVLLHGHGLDYTFRGLYLPLTLLRLFGRTLTIPRLDPMPVDGLAERLYRNVCYQVRHGSTRVLFRGTTHAELRVRMVESIRRVLASYAGPATSVHNLWDYFVTHSIYKHFTFLNVTCIRAHIDERTVIFDNDLFDVYLGMPPSLRLGGPVYRQAIRRLSPDLASAPSPRSGHRVDLPLSFYLEWALTTGGGLLRTGRSLARAWGPSHATAPDPDAADTEGSWPDMNRLIRHHAGLQQLIRDTIRDRRCLDPEIFDVGAIEGHLKEHLAGRNLNDLLLAVLTFGRWHRKYGP